MLFTVSEVSPHLLAGLVCVIVFAAIMAALFRTTRPLARAPSIQREQHALRIRRRELDKHIAAALERDMRLS
jgi:hypothetical protein